MTTITTIEHAKPNANASYSLAVMHHPARRDILKRMRAQLDAHIAQVGSYSVITDPEPFGSPETRTHGNTWGISPWRTARVAWGCAPITAEWRVVIQDDAILCDRFGHVLPAVLAAADTRGADGVSLYMGVHSTQSCQEMINQHAAGESFSWLHPADWVPTVGLALRTRLAATLAAYQVPPHAIADDEVTGRCARDNHWRILQTIPSVIQHDDEAPSTLHGHRVRQHGSSRTAAFYDPAISEDRWS